MPETKESEIKETQTPETKNLYIFIDESGNFDFSPNGTNYFVLACISTTNPLVKRDIFLSLKYKLLAEGIEQEYFHATEDKQKVRNVVFSTIKELDDFEAHSVIAQKNKVNWSLYEEINIRTKKDGKGIKFSKKQVEEKLYRQLGETLVKWVFRGYNEHKKLNIGKVIIIFDSLFNKAKQEFVKKYLKTYFKKEFNIIPYIYFHQVKSDINCQIADYCGWAIFKKWEQDDLRSYEEIKDKIKSQFDIFQTGTTIYYNYKKKTSPPIQ